MEKERKKAEKSDKLETFGTKISQTENSKQTAQLDVNALLTTKPAAGGSGDGLVVYKVGW